MKRVAGVALVALTALGAGSALADQANPSGDRHGRLGQRFQQELGLSDAQMQAIRDIRAHQRDAARQLGQALGQANRDMRQLALSGADDTAIQAKIDEITRLEQQMLRLRVDALRQIAPQLTDEQKQKLAQWSPWRGHPHGRGPQQPQG